MSRLAWAKAKTVLGGLFAEWPTDWPQRFAPVHLARLQSPPNGKDWSLTRAFEVAISGACTAGELAHEAAAFVFPPIAFGCHLEDTPAEKQAKWRAQCRTVQLPAVAAGEFVAWLGVQGEKPSEHVAAWMEATAPGMVASAPAADRGNRVKRAALIERNRRRWPSIERDLKDASANGLSTAAKADTIGYWWEGDAIKWAEARNKLPAPAEPVSLARVVHRMAG